MSLSLILGQGQGFKREECELGGEKGEEQWKDTKNGRIDQVRSWYQNRRGPIADMPWTAAEGEAVAILGQSGSAKRVEIVGRGRLKIWITSIY